MVRLITQILIAAFLAIVVWNCRSENQEPVQTVHNESEFPSQEGRNSELYISKAGRKQAVLKYGHMRKYDKKKLILFDEGVEVDFYDEFGRHTTHLTALEGEYYEATRDVLGRGNVVAVSDSGVTLKTEELRWDNRNGRIFSDSMVRVTTTSGDTLYGIGFESNADLSRRVIYKPWGITDENVDLNEMEKQFADPPKQEISEQDSVIVEKNDKNG